MSNDINQIQTLKGFRDFLGPTAKKRMWFIEKIRSVFIGFGFEPLETPTLEYESLLLGKYGTEADKLVYGFEDKGGRRVALRYDQTVPTARIVSQYRNDIVFPYKRYQIQPVWRADKPQKGRYREFMQCDADIIGIKNSLVDAEILAVYYNIYKAIGLTSIQLSINDRASLIQLITSSGVAESLVFSTIQTIDKLEKVGKEGVIKELIERGLTTTVANAVLNSIENATLPDTLSEIVNAAVSLGVPQEALVFNPALARGLDYYTGIIFEGIVPEYTVGSVGGGGRYDNLINDLVGYDTPAVGFAVGFDRTLEAAEEAGLIPNFESSATALVTIFSPELKNKSIKIINSLRNNNISVELFLDENKKLDNQLKYANKKNIPFVVIIGPEEDKKNIVQLKDMKTGEKKELSIDELIKLLLLSST